MSKYRNVKIHVPTPEISEAVQKKLFEDGCFWDGSNQHEVKYTDSQYLYVTSRGSMECGAYKSTFVDAAEKEVPYQSILDPYYDVKIAWANGEAVQRTTQTKNEKKWVDWNYSGYLDIEAGYNWRIKPKTKTIKQWERRYWDGNLANIVISTDEKPDWSVLGCVWLSEPELKEYEVPND